MEQSKFSLFFYLVRSEIEGPFSASSCEPTPCCVSRVVLSKRHFPLTIRRSLSTACGCGSLTQLAIAGKRLCSLYKIFAKDLHALTKDTSRGHVNCARGMENYPVKLCDLSPMQVTIGFAKLGRCYSMIDAYHSHYLFKKNCLLPTKTYTTRKCYQAHACSPRYAKAVQV